MVEEQRRAEDATAKIRASERDQQQRDISKRVNEKKARGKKPLKHLSQMSRRERQADGTYRYRLAGTELQTYFGQELTGKSLDSWVGEQAVGPLQTAFDRMVEHPCGQVNVINLSYGSDLPTLLECVTFPFAGPTPAQLITHVAVLNSPLDLQQVQTAQAGPMNRLEGIDLGAGVADFSDITW